MRTVQGPNGAAGGSSGSFGGLSIAGGSMLLRAGMALAEKDLITIDEDGLAYKGTDATCVVNPNKDQSIIATTAPDSVTTAGGTLNAPIRFANGTFMTYVNDVTNNRHNFSLWARDGALLKTTLVSYSPSNLWTRWGVLSNGNIVVVSNVQSSMRYIIIAPDTTVVVAETVIEATTAVGTASLHEFICLSGGGFALAWSGGSPAFTRWGIYSNTGAVVLAPNTLYTLGSGAQAATATLAQFANGNVAIFARHEVAGNALRFGVFTSTGTPVLAYGAWTPAAGNETVPSRLVVLGNLLCVAWGASGPILKAAVVDQNGAQIGSTFSLSNNNFIALDTDGTDFLILSVGTSPYYISVTRLPVSGTGAVTVNLSKQINGGASPQYPKATFVDDEWLVQFGVTAGGVTTASRVRLDATVVSVGTIHGSNAGDHTPPVIWAPGVALYWFPNNSNYYSYAVKRYRACAIQGVAAAAAAKGATVALVAANGTYQTNPIVCATPTNFNHNATTIIGQRGTLLPQGIALRGLVA